jgi:hypothetical protein
MPNPHKGEAAFEVDGVVYTLRLSTNAICELETAMDKGLDAIVGNMARLSTVRGLLWAALRDHHPEITMAGAGILIDKAGMAAAMNAVTAALTAAFPPKTDEKAGPTNPQ